MARNYWLHRISHESGLSNVLLEKRNELSIGFSDFSSDEYLQEILTNGLDGIWNVVKKEWKEGRPRSCFSLYHFLCEMKQGDYVLVPSSYTFSVYEIVDEKPFSNESLDTTNLQDVWGNPIILDGEGYLCSKGSVSRQIDLGFYWKVKPVEVNIPRAEYADQALVSRMKVRQTTLNINDLEKNILESIEMFKKKSPINLHNLAMEQAAGTLLNLIREKIDADKFEELVRKYMVRIGADDTTVPAKNNSEEGDADVIAYFEPIKTAILIQVKKHVGNTDSWAVDQITAFRKNNKGLVDYSKLLWIISTCDDFTNETKDKAQSENVRLINGRMFAEMLLDADFGSFIVKLCGCTGKDIQV